MFWGELSEGMGRLVLQYRASGLGPSFYWGEVCCDELFFVRVVRNYPKKKSKPDSVSCLEIDFNIGETKPPKSLYQKVHLCKQVSLCFCLHYRNTPAHRLFKPAEKN